MPDTLNCIALTILSGGAIVGLIVAFALAIRAGQRRT